MFSIKSLQALLFAGKEPFPTIYVESQKEGEVGYKFLTCNNNPLLIFKQHQITVLFVFLLPQRWAVISKTQMKNAKKAFNREQMKSDAKEKKEVCVPLFSVH